MSNIFVFGHARPFSVGCVQLALRFNRFNTCSVHVGCGHQSSLYFSVHFPVRHSGVPCAAMLRERWADFGTLALAALN
jgi:hypothetical protein